MQLIKFFVVAALVIGTVYFLSIGPAALTVEMRLLSRDTLVYQSLADLYSPAFAVADATGLGNAYEGYVGLWAPTEAEDSLPFR